jgi:IS30 family transposase
MAEIKRNRQLEAKLSASKAFRELEKEINSERVGITKVEPEVQNLVIDVRPVQ